MNEDNETRTTKPKKQERFKPRIVKNTKHAVGKYESNGRRPSLRIVAGKVTALVGLLLASLSVEGRSSLNPLTQTYTVQETDQIGTLKLKRTYSSGSLFRGHFGIGWCSEIDGKINIYDQGEVRFRGCDLASADLVDLRQSQKSIRRTAAGFERLRDDGARQIFSKYGFLEKVVRVDGEIRITRDIEMRPIEITFQNRGSMRTEKVRVELQFKDADPSFALVQGLGGNSYVYQEQLLVQMLENGKSVVKYAYDEQMNMTSNFGSTGSETIDYDPHADRVTGLARSAAFGRERLLLSIARDEKSGMIEMKIELEIQGKRGAETHPVRILYNITNHRIELNGDRSIARMILNLIRA